MSSKPRAAGGGDKQRVRVTKACVGCKAARRKCSGDAPCDYCTKRGAECVFEESTRKRGPKAGAKAALLVAENERLRAELERIKTLSLSGGSGGSHPPAYPALVPQPRAAPSHQQQLFPEQVWSVDAPILPTEKELSTLRTYFDYTNKILPCVDEEAFYAVLESVRYLGDGTGGSPTPPPPAPSAPAAASAHDDHDDEDEGDDEEEDYDHSEEEEEEEEEDDEDNDDDDDDDDEDYVEGRRGRRRSVGGGRKPPQQQHASDTVLGKRRGGAGSSQTAAAGGSSAAPSAPATAQPHRPHPIVSVARNSELFGFRVLYYTLLCIGSKVSGRFDDARRYYELARAFIGPVFSTPSKHLVSALLLMVMITRALCADDKQASLHAALALRMSEVADVTPEMRMVAVLFAHAHSAEAASWPPPRESVRLIPSGGVGAAPAAQTPTPTPAAAPGGSGSSLSVAASSLPHGKPIPVHLRFADVIGFVVSQVMLEFPALRQGAYGVGGAGTGGGDGSGAGTPTAGPDGAAASVASGGSPAIDPDAARRFAALLDEAEELQRTTGLLKAFPVNVMASGVRALLLLRGTAGGASPPGSPTPATTASAASSAAPPVSPALMELTRYTSRHARASSPAGTDSAAGDTVMAGTAEGGSRSAADADGDDGVELMECSSGDVDCVKRQALRLAVRAVDNARANPYSRFCFPCVLLQGKLIAATMPLAGPGQVSIACAGLQPGAAAPAGSFGGAAPAGGDAAGVSAAAAPAAASSSSADPAQQQEIPELARVFLKRACTYVREARGRVCTSAGAGGAAAGPAGVGAAECPGTAVATSDSCSPCDVPCDGVPEACATGGVAPAWPAMSTCPTVAAAAAADAPPVGAAPMEAAMGMCPSAHEAQARGEAHASSSSGGGNLAERLLGMSGGAPAAAAAAARAAPTPAASTAAATTTAAASVRAQPAARKGSAAAPATAPAADADGTSLLRLSAAAAPKKKARRGAAPPATSAPSAAAVHAAPAPGHRAQPQPAAGAAGAPTPAAAPQPPSGVAATGALAAAGGQPAAAAGPDAVDPTSRISIVPALIPGLVADGDDEGEGDVAFDLDAALLQPALSSGLNAARYALPPSFSAFAGGLQSSAGLYRISSLDTDYGGTAPAAAAAAAGAGAADGGAAFSRGELLPPLARAAGGYSSSASSAASVTTHSSVTGDGSEGESMRSSSADISSLGGGMSLVTSSSSPAVAAASGMGRLPPIFEPGFLGGVMGSPGGAATVRPAAGGGGRGGFDPQLVSLARFAFSDLTGDFQRQTEEAHAEHDAAGSTTAAGAAPPGGALSSLSSSMPPTDAASLAEFMERLPPAILDDDLDLLMQM